MNIYFILLIIILPYMSLFIDDKYKKVAFTFIFAFVFFVSSSKGSTSSFDLNNYYSAFFNDTPSLDNFFNSSIFNYRYEFGYTFLSSITYTLTKSFYIHISVVSFIVLSLYYYFITKNSKYILISLIIYISFYFFRNEMITIRGGCSTAMYFAALCLYSNKKYKLYFLFSMLSMSFHNVGVLSFIPILLNFNRFYNKQLLLFIFISSVFISILKPLSLIVTYESYFPDFININRIGRYLGIESGFGIKSLVIYLPFYILIYFNYEKIKKIKNIAPFLNSFFVGGCILLSFNEIATLSRLYQYLMISIIILFPAILSICNRNTKIIFICYLFTACIYTVIRMVFFNSGGGLNLYA